MPDDEDAVTWTACPFAMQNSCALRTAAALTSASPDIPPRADEPTMKVLGPVGVTSETVVQAERMTAVAISQFFIKCFRSRLK